MAIVVPIVSEWNPKGVEKSVADISKAQGGWSKAGAGFKAAFLPAVGVAAAVGAAMLKTAGAASDLNEAVSATRQVFGPASAAVETWAKSADKAAGMSQTAALSAAQTFGTFGKAAGLAGGDLSGFSTQMVGLAGDLASFKNTSPEEAIQAIGAALRGESEPIRKYGVLLDDASLRQEAVRQGIIKTTKQALTPQQKVLAAHALILKQTSDAQGDFARTSDGAANQQRIMNAEIENIQSNIGQTFLPLLQKMLTMFSGLAGFVKDNATAASILLVILGTLATAIIAVNLAMKAYAIANTVFQAVTGSSTVSLWAFTAALLANPITWVVIGVVALIAALVLLWVKCEGFRKVVTAVFQAMLGAVKAVWNWVKANWPLLLMILLGPVGIAVVGIIRNWDKVKAALLAVYNWLKGVFTTVWNGVSAAVGKVTGAIIGAWNKVWDVISGIWSKIQGVIGKVGGFLSHIPGLGGLGGKSAPASQSYSLAYGPSALSGGRAAGQLVRGQAPVTVNVFGALDAESVARQVKSLLTSHEVRQGRAPSERRGVAW